jgi:hypothetical protein
MASMASSLRSKDPVSGGNPAFAMGQGAMSDRYWAAVDTAAGSQSRNPYSSLFPRATGSGDGMAGVPQDERSYREKALDNDLGSTLYADAAKQLGIKNLDSANDLGQVIAHINGQKKQESAPAVDPAKAKEAFDASQAWRYQNKQEEGVQGRTPGDALGVIGQGSGSGSGSGSGTGFGSFASYLDQGPDNSNGLYDDIYNRGDDMARSFLSIGRNYYNTAMLETDEIGRAITSSVSGLTAQPTDYIDPWTTKIDGKTYVERARGLANG